MLREVLALDTLDEAARDAFTDMQEGLGYRRELSEKQRAWLRSVLDEPDYANLASKGGTQAPRAARHNHGERAECLASCPAWTPPTLRNLPMKPPGRA